MEVQAVHVKAEENYATLSKAAAAKGLLIVSYLYQVCTTHVDVGGGGKPTHGTKRDTWINLI